MLSGGLQAIFCRQKPLRIICLLRYTVLYIWITVLRNWLHVGPKIVNGNGFDLLAGMDKLNGHSQAFLPGRKSCKFPLSHVCTSPNIRVAEAPGPVGRSSYTQLFARSHFPSLGYSARYWNSFLRLHKAWMGEECALFPRERGNLPNRVKRRGSFPVIRRVPLSPLFSSVFLPLTSAISVQNSIFAGRLVLLRRCSTFCVRVRHREELQLHLRLQRSL